ncbi:hypothetical protein PybrP1_000519 [[Pythium] brassicae (nom. inval.)]|nr:hypothetical protein PybrP1_000519 [[Pythium] brassicae (nom. inval.)]
MALFGKLFIAIGSLLLLHAGYYSVKYAEYVKLAEVTDAKLPPTEVVLELVLAFAISLAGVLVTAGELLPIRSNKRLHGRSLATVISSPDFHVFNHRGKALHKRIAA